MADVIHVLSVNNKQRKYHVQILIFIITKTKNKNKNKQTNKTKQMVTKVMSAFMLHCSFDLSLYTLESNKQKKEK